MNIRMATYDGVIATHEVEVNQRVKELEQVFDPPYDNLTGLVLEGHEPGECVQCDAYRKMANDSSTSEPS
jgi:hypothetical protein